MAKSVEFRAQSLEPRAQSGGKFCIPTPKEWSESGVGSRVYSLERRAFLIDNHYLKLIT